MVASIEKRNYKLSDAMKGIKRELNFNIEDLKNPMKKVELIK